MTAVDRVVLSTAPGVSRVLFQAGGESVELWVEGEDAPSLVGGIAVATARIAGDAAVTEVPGASGYLRGARRRDGERILVEVVRDGAGEKRATLRDRVELAGDAIVLTPFHGDFAIAASIRAKGKRSAIKAALQPLLPDGMGATVRSAATDRAPVELADEMLRLVAVWRDITDRALTAEPPAWLVPPPPLSARIAAHAPGAEIVADPDGSGFRAAGGEEALDRGLARRVGFPGGTLIVEEGETATLVDVNLARSPRGDALVRANLDAVRTVAGLARLRGLRGTILVDCPRMRGRGDRDRVAATMAEAVGPDRAAWHILGWTPGGMLECVREGVRRPLSAEMLVPLADRGLSARARAWAALDRLRREVGGIARPRLVVPREVAAWLDGPGAAIVARERRRLGALTVQGDAALRADDVRIESET
jgi:hypothetical protein